MTPETHAGFTGLGIAPKLLDILERNQYVTPTPIQAQAIPVAIEGKDLIGIAQTGTGKTLAFGIPMLQRLAQHKGQGLILLPTRELAMQVDEALRKVGTPLGLRTAVIIGGASMNVQLQHLRQRPHIVIATPGRLIDHLEQKTVDLAGVTILILDEADRMLDMGFAPQINRILVQVPKARQTMLFSATMPQAIVSIASKHMHLPLRVEVARSGTTADRVEQEVIFIEKNDKPRLLEQVLSDVHGSVLVFSRTKFGARRIARAVKQAGHTTADIHSNRSLSQRKDALEGFKTGRYRVLVATDIAARGIDVTGIELVVNYDLPSTAEDYVHRIGRTGRAGLPGRAISFATPDQHSDIRAIERLIRTPLPSKRATGLPPARPRPEFEPREFPVRQFSRTRQGRGSRQFHGSRSSGFGGASSHSRPPRRFGRRQP